MSVDKKIDQELIKIYNLLPKKNKDYKIKIGRINFDVGSKKN